MHDVPREGSARELIDEDPANATAGRRASSGLHGPDLAGVAGRAPKETRLALSLVNALVDQTTVPSGSTPFFGTMTMPSRM